MTLAEFAALVGKMREAQTAFFKGRLPIHLTLSKQLEAQVDKAVEEVRDGQLSLFDKE